MPWALALGLWYNTAMRTKNKPSLSAGLRLTVIEVEAATGRRVVIHSNSHRTEGSLLLIEGYHAAKDGAEHIWFNGRLPRAAGEAIIAHELAHILQRAAGFATVSVAPGETPQTQRLALRISAMALDLNADHWAAARGFDIKSALQNSTMPVVASAMSRHNDTQNHNQAHTQLLAIDYATLKLRLEPFGLFSALDALWQERWPGSRGIGERVAAALRRYRFSSAASCRRAMTRALAVLGIPEDRMRLV